MASKSNNEVPPVPVPPAGSMPPPVPPIEPAPTAKTAPKVAPKMATGSAANAAPKTVTPPPVPVAASAPSVAPGAGAPAVPPAAPAYGAPGYVYSPAPAGPPQGLSITSMILGIAGLFFGFLVSIAAVITGHMAQKSQPHARPFWLTGIITGYIGIGIGVIVTIIFILWLAFILSLAGSTSLSSF